MLARGRAATTGRGREATAGRGRATTTAGRATTKGKGVRAKGGKANVRAGGGIPGIREHAGGCDLVFECADYHKFGSTSTLLRFVCVRCLRGSAVIS